jgi:hypothetical protein
LLAALDQDERDALIRALEVLEKELPNLYAAEVADHREARGDDGQLFGMKIWTHGWFRYEGLFGDDPIIRVLRNQGSWELSIGRVRVGIYRQGSSVDHSVYNGIPCADSDAKRSYGERNEAQLELFEDLPVEARESCALLDLTVVHFGNARDGLVKWYVGAQAPPGAWAWVTRLPLAEADSDAGMVDQPPVVPLRPTGGVVPFDQRPVEDIDVRPRIQPLREARDSDDEQ